MCVCVCVYAITPNSAREFSDEKTKPSANAAVKCVKSSLPSSSPVVFAGDRREVFGSACVSVWSVCVGVFSHDDGESSSFCAHGQVVIPSRFASQTRNEPTHKVNTKNRAARGRDIRRRVHNAPKNISVIYY